MKCFGCGNEIDGRVYMCPYCGADILLYKQILYTSDIYYNRGLDEARVRDLSGAIASCRASLQYNKYNTRARNLLGLLYLEVGETVRAANEWLLSKYFQADNPLADYYLGYLDSDSSYMAQMSSAIKKYNQALEYCRVGSKDLAIIALKKVVAINPGLVAANQLLALLYLDEGDLDEASKILIAINKIDTNNNITQRYLKEVKLLIKQANAQGGRKRKEPKLAGEEEVAVATPLRALLDAARSSFLDIVIGVVLGILATFYLIYPQKYQNYLTEQTDMVVNSVKELESVKAELAQIQNEYNVTSDSLAAYENRPDIASSYEQLLSAQRYIYEGKNDEAAEILIGVNTEVLTDSGLKLYNNLYERLNPDIIDYYYNEGHSFYSQGNYISASQTMLKVVELKEDYLEGNALYLLGDSYRLIDNDEQATIYFKRLVQLFPNSDLANQATTYLTINDAN